MFKKSLFFLILIVSSFSLFAQQSFTVSELPDSINLDESGNGIFKGKIFSFYWAAEDTLIDISFASKSENKDEIVYNLVLDTTSNDTLPLSLKWSDDQEKNIIISFKLNIKIFG